MIRKILNRKKVNPSIPIFTGVQQAEEIGLQLFRYSEDTFEEQQEYKSEEFTGFEDDHNRYWLNIHGLHDIKQIENICRPLGIHDLAIQDILDINQRPKFQEFDSYWFFTLKSICPENKDVIELEHLSFILGRNFLVSFQEKKADYFDHIRQRIRTKTGKVREKGPDYLLFLLLESILDNYFISLNDIENKIEALGFVDMDSDPSPASLKTIEHYKRQVHLIKKTIVPIKEFVAKIEREQFGFVQEDHIKYFYELRDLCLSLIDECEHNELRLESSANMFFSVQGHLMNQVMKTLTVVATTFIPLTFIAGIYGMNFSNMPELNWKWGYYGVWGIIVAVFLGMLYYFKRKKWF